MSCQERQLTLATLLKDQRTERRALCNLGCAAKWTKDYDRALDCFQKGLEMATNEGDKKAEGKFLNNIASTYESMADFENAITYYEMRSKLAKSTKDVMAETKCCASIGNVLHVSGNIRESIKYFERVVVCIKLKIGTYAVQRECACLAIKVVKIAVVAFERLKAINTIDSESHWVNITCCVSAEEKSDKL